MRVKKTFVILLVLTSLVLGCRNYNIGKKAYENTRDGIIQNLQTAQTNIGTSNLKDLLDESVEILESAHGPYVSSQRLLEERKLFVFKTKVTPNDFEVIDQKIDAANAGYHQRLKTENATALKTVKETKDTLEKVQKTFESLKKGDTSIALALQYTLHYTSVVRANVDKLDFISDERKQNIKDVLDDIDLVVKEFEQQLKFFEILSDDNKTAEEKLQELANRIEALTKVIEELKND
ncbi:hypothetical protein [Candidatus Uabimicrobium amorphum]|uniref:Lipoprotein n=1 Tax=Uabimicrobium amorphum TaxID=2596890 RepID=A0A5S9F631_UABAM|nr:hypothetical protein [Candidatus Uabimicrobium amorphum]BBM86229.1 hypothetical protein UABAM_04615 [Candidatus Uabimicrobium amorphum]